MANSAVLSATGVIKASSGNLYNINVTKAGTGSTWTIYDNPSTGAGRVLATGDGIATQSFSLQSPTSGVQAGTGMYCVMAGTTNPTIVVIYE